MMRRKRQQHPINQHNMLEIVNNTLAVQEVHCRAQKVPIQRLGEAQPTRTTPDIGNGNDLLEGNNLHRRDDDDHVNVAREHAAEEDTNHDECPYRAGYKGLLLLVVGGLFWGCGCLFIIGPPFCCCRIATLVGWSFVVAVVGVIWALSSTIAASAAQVETSVVSAVFGHVLAGSAGFAVVEFDVAFWFGHGCGCAW